MKIQYSNWMPKCSRFEWLRLAFVNLINDLAECNFHLFFTKLPLNNSIFRHLPQIFLINSSIWNEFRVLTEHEVQKIENNNTKYKLLRSEDSL